MAAASFQSGPSPTATEAATNPLPPYQHSRQRSTPQTNRARRFDAEAWRQANKKEYFTAYKPLIAAVVDGRHSAAMRGVIAVLTRIPRVST